MTGSTRESRRQEMVDAAVIRRSKELKDVFDQQLADRDDKIDQLTTQLKAITDALAASAGNKSATYNIASALAPPGCASCLSSAFFIGST